MDSGTTSCRVVSLAREKLRRDRGAPNRGTTESEGGATRNNGQATHTQIRRELATKIQLLQQDKYNDDQDYNRQAGERPCANTHTHNAHRQREMEPPPEALGLSMKQRRHSKAYKKQ